MSKVATLLKTNETDESEFFLNRSGVYQLNPPFKGHELVVVSEASSIDFGVNETMVFAANADYSVSDWTDLHVIYETSQKKCLADMGYTVNEKA